MKKFIKYFCLILILIYGVYCLISSGLFRKKNSDPGYPSSPEEINTSVFNHFDPYGGYQTLHINMDNNEHYVVLANPIVKDSIVSCLDFLLYNAKNSFYTIDEFDETEKNGNEITIPIYVKKISFFEPQINPPTPLCLENITISPGDIIDVHIIDEKSKEKEVKFISEVGGHICTSKVME